MTAHGPADWQLPPGVSRAVWDYVHDARLARDYDSSLAGTPLLQMDVKFVQKHCQQPGRLIDLGCGTGRLAVEMAQRGFWVVGVDLSEEMLRRAQARARQANVNIELVQANLVDLRGLADASFDYAACLFSTLGMISGAAHRRTALAHVHRLLRPGGRFVLHVHNWWFNLWDRAGRRWLFHDIWQRLCGREAGDRPMLAPPGLVLHHFTRSEIVRLLRAVGFRLREVQPVSLRPDGQLPWPWCLGMLRAYGYLLAAEKCYSVVSG